MTTFTDFDRWANQLRAGGQHRRGTEGTSGERCSVLQGGRQECGLCHATPKREVDPDCLAEGHPVWYCAEVKEPIAACPQVEIVQEMNRRSAGRYYGSWALALLGLAACLAWWLAA